jgi:hypothetical protein
MFKILEVSIFCLLFGFLSGCASSIVDGEHICTSSTALSAKAPDAPIDVYFSDKAPTRKTTEVGRVLSRAWVIEKGIDELKKQARKLGADAVTNVRYERKFSVDYLQDLYFITGDAVIWQ